MRYFIGGIAGIAALTGGLSGISLAADDNAASPRTPGSQVTARPDDVVVTRIGSGLRLEGRLTRLDSARVEIIPHSGGPAVEIPRGDLESLSRPVARNRGALSPPLLFLTTGDILRARPVATTEERLLAAWEEFPGTNPISVPLELVRGVWSPGGLPPKKTTSGAIQALPASKVTQMAALSDTTEWWRRILNRTSADDMVWLANGDTITGELRTLSEGAYRIHSTAARMDIEVADSTVDGWRFGSELSVVPPRAGSGVVVLLADGSRLDASEVRLGESGLEIESRFGRKIALPLVALSELRPYGDRVRYLSDEKPREYVQTPFLKLTWPLGIDRSADGGPLIMDGGASAKGLGLHASAVVSYPVGKEDRQFRARFGLDAAAGHAGSVVGEVWVDDRRAFASPVMRAGDAAIEIPPVTLTGVNTITLKLLPAGRADIRDLADFAEARIVR